MSETAKQEATFDQLMKIVREERRRPPEIPKEAGPAHLVSGLFRWIRGLGRTRG